MDNNIPTIIEELYLALIPEPNPRNWPEYLKDQPVKAHGLWSFYQGLQIGLQLGSACMNEG